MNAAVPEPVPQIEPLDFRPPATALRRLALRLGRAHAIGKVSDAAFAYAVDEALLEELVERWCEALDAGASIDELHAYPWFRLAAPGTELSFVHLPSREVSALPLLLLHGYWGSLTELAGLAAPLTAPEAHGGSPGDAFHVVCPGLPGFGVTRRSPNATASANARSCARLMAQLGYERYAVHGSGMGASVAAELAALAPDRVKALHVTSLNTFPDDTPEELATLTSGEKSQLARLTLDHDALWHELPTTPIEDLAYALQQLDDWRAPPSAYAPLLRSLTLAWVFGDSAARRELFATELLRARPHFEAPVALETFPLDAPCLRRFAERRFRVHSVVEHATGGNLPALESPRELVESLRRSFHR